MFVQQLYTNCLAEAAYYIESNGEAAIIDPIRETSPYLELARQRNTKIKYVFETHFHADFISGHIDLAKQTGAVIVFGPGAEPDYKTHIAKDGEEFKIGNITLRAMHTPGHTPESTCYLLFDESYQQHCVFTGDTLFVGDVGRPDLLDGKMSKETLAGMMYDSLNNKIKKLPDEVLVYPAHGPGSACGKSLGKETWSTIGHQKKTNYALREMNREEFIKEVCDGLVAPPAYFFSDAKINKQGYDAIDDVLKKNVRALSVDEFAEEMERGTSVLDTRINHVFEKGFVKGSLHIGLDGMYAIWVGTLIDIHKPLLVVCEVGKEEESILRLARVGYENVKGFLSGGFDAWKNAGKPVDTVVSVDAEMFAQKVSSGISVLDVRNFSEAETGHIKNAKVIPLAELSTNMKSLDTNKTLYVHCAGGYRSMIAASILKAKGFKNIVNVLGGWSKIKETSVPVETGAPSDLIAG
ncbi:MAG: rhodanese-like domain-containing protein [Bacteroidetes bacterium]|nr:rhodanese-like domain-containing protein [Bacteroidota bacterium]